MNSFTSSSEVSRRYALGLLLITGLPVALLFLFGIFLQPLYGDLTRLGGYSEREFGPNVAQLEFDPPLYSADVYDSHKDIVILGDSFSRVWPKQQWQNHIAALTGWSVSTQDINTVSLQSILKSKIFVESPPRFLIYESVERYLPHRIPMETCDRATTPQTRLKHFDIPVYDTGIIDQYADLSPRPRHLLDVTVAFSGRFLWKSAARWAFGADGSETIKAKLSREDLFSSLRRDDLLFHKDDVKSQVDWAHTDIMTISCGIERLRASVEENGVTHLVVMVPPNKLTAYSEFIADKDYGSTRHLSKLAELQPALIPRIDLAISSAINSGEKDVYLPDDTHWSGKGHQLVAKELIDFLRGTTN